MTRRRTRLMAVMLTLLALRDRSAADEPPTGTPSARPTNRFEIAFTPATIAALVPVGARRVLVVAAGPAANEAAAAVAAALATPLDSRGQAGPPRDVRTDVASEGEGDPAIAARAQAAATADPFDAIAVVRVYAASAGQPETALVTVKGRSGEPLASALAPAGGAFLMRRSDRRVDANAAPSPSGLARAAESALAHGYIGFGRGWNVDGVRRDEPYIGVEHRRLDDELFYRVVGRADLARSYDQRRGARLGLFISGSILVPASLSLLIFSAFFPTRAYEYGCVDGTAGAGCNAFGVIPVDRVNGPLVAGAVLGALGVAALIAGGSVARQPVGAAERLELARRYNAGVARGIAPPDETRPPGPGASLRLAPQLAPGRAGLALEGRF